MRSIRFVRKPFFDLVLPTLAMPSHASTQSKAVRTREHLGPALSLPQQAQNAAKSSISSRGGAPVQSPATSVLQTKVKP
jgi:hypothetical protein